MQYDTRQYSFLFAAGGFGDNVQLLMPSVYRVAIIFQPITSSPWGFGIRPIDAAADIIIVNISNEPTELLYKDYGDLVRREWWGNAPGAATRVNVTEVFYIP